MELINGMSAQFWAFSYIIDDGCQQEVEIAGGLQDSGQNEEFEKIRSEVGEMMEQNMEQLLKYEVKDKVGTSEMSSGERIQTLQSQQNHSACAEQTPQMTNRDGQQNEENSQSQYRGDQRNTNRRVKINEYPTKNFLQNMRRIILEQIYRHYSKALSHPVIRKIKNKTSINCKDFQDLLNQPQFHDILTIYFKNKKIYRDILQAQMSFKMKKICHSKVGVIEKAFRTGKFEKIN